MFSVRVRGTNSNTLNMSTSRNPQDYRNTGRLRNTCRSSPLLLEKSDISVTCPVYLFLLMLSTPPVRNWRRCPPLRAGSHVPLLGFRDVSPRAPGRMETVCYETVIFPVWAASFVSGREPPTHNPQAIENETGIMAHPPSTPCYSRVMTCVVHCIRWYHMLYMCSFHMFHHMTSRLHVPHRVLSFGVFHSIVNILHHDYAPS